GNGRASSIRDIGLSQAGGRRLVGDYTAMTVVFMLAVEQPAQDLTQQASEKSAEGWVRDETTAASLSYGTQPCGGS
ncbi:MAG: hypothetical protein AAAB13_09145, partial [Pseudomonas sp.]